VRTGSTTSRKSGSSSCHQRTMVGRHQLPDTRSLKAPSQSSMGSVAERKFRSSVLNSRSRTRALGRRLWIVNRPRSLARIGTCTVATLAVGRRHDRGWAARSHGTRSHQCTLVPDVGCQSHAERRRHRRCNHVVILHARITTSCWRPVPAIRRPSCASNVRDPLWRNAVSSITAARRSEPRLCGRDGARQGCPRHARRFAALTRTMRSRCFGIYRSVGSVSSNDRCAACCWPTSWVHRRAESRFMSVMPHARPA
jgi:hypothetical protein